MTPLSLLLSVTVGLFFSLRPAMATENPQYTVVKVDGDFEIRQYEPRIVAEVSVDGDLDAASGHGFRVLADYIFGNNRPLNNPTMTVSPEVGTKISMTAPVTVEPIAANSTMTSAREWRVEFTMPRGYTLADLPRPNNESIQLREITARTYATVRYSGMNTERRINEEADRLLDWIKHMGLVATGEPELARYNPPWTLPMFRRNEILVPVSN